MELPGQQGHQQEYGIGPQAAGVPGGGLDPEEDREDRRVDDHGHQRVQHRPCPAEGRPLVLGSEVPEGQVDEQVDLEAADQTFKQVSARPGDPRGGGHRAILPVA